MVIDNLSHDAIDAGISLEGAAELAIMGDTDTLLATCRLVGNSGHVVEVVVNRRAVGALLQYLYGKGRRDVSIETQEARRHGRLYTSWNGRRRWFIQLV